MSELDSSWVDRDDPASRMAAALEAADAIGRERVSEASGWDVIRAFRDAYNAEASAMGIPTTDQHSQDVAMCQAAGAFAVARLFLTAAPAERETAADAAAAPAVGVTVEWLDARIAEEQAILDQSRKREHRAFHAGQATALMSVRNRMLNEDFAPFEETDLGPLLTAQPEPGTHDDAGQPATEGGEG